MEKLACKKCGLIDVPKIVKKSNNNVAFCSGCGTYIKNVPHDIPKFYIGKYKGMAISSVTDIGYLEWFLANIEKLSANAREGIKAQIAFIKTGKRTA